MYFPNKVINAYQKTVNAAGLLNEADQIYYANLDIQSECLFEMYITPENFLGALNPSVLLDTLMSRYYIYDVNIPLVGFEFSRYNGKREISEIIYPEELTVTFIENSKGTVKSYLRKWVEEICTFDTKTKEYSFNDNQLISKRKALLIPHSKDMIPSLEYIEITGMKFQATDGLHFGQDSGEMQKITVTFSVDNCRLVSTFF